MLSRRRRVRRANGPFRREKPLPPDNPDIAAYDVLRKCDARVHEGRMVNFYLYLTSKKRSQLAAAELECLGMIVEQIQNGRGDWLCLASRMLLPRPSAFAGMRRIFEDLADRYGGRYDGWEAMILEPVDGAVPLDRPQ